MGRWKKLRRIALVLLAAVLALAILIAVAFNVSPWPSALLFRRAFTASNVTEPRGLAAMKSKVTVHRNLSYPSSYKRNDFDLYTPKQLSGSVPIIVWVHGGGFIAGDKSGVTSYATMLASEGYAVAAMNYDYAPDAQYPTPVIQVGEMITRIYQIAQSYGLDADRIIIAGDSAGAQIAAQFAALQTTPGYAQEAGIPKIALRKPLEAAVLFCGPYDVSKLSSIGSSWMAKAFVQSVGWSYLGSKHWEGTKAARMASVVDHLSEEFPRSYVVDGNYFSFPAHARALISGLKADGVSVSSTLYPDKPELPHEFQFDFSHLESYEVWKQTLEFLKS
ncbi:MAG: alpha/beta hydrolase [Bifidobacterium psychraerophilum]|uniref:alpha/beta hydrolase n=1 Tax=Bifidobacterium psychraerophilum TaxID=218140 RepID=UPI0039EA8BB5